MIPTNYPSQNYTFPTAYLTAAALSVGAFLQYREGNNESAKYLAAASGILIFAKIATERVRREMDINPTEPTKDISTIGLASSERPATSRFSLKLPFYRINTDFGR